MAYDKTDPRNNLILGIGILAAVSLIALIPVFHSYYHFMLGREFAAKVEQVPNTELGEYRQAQQARLGSARVSVEQAMAQIAQGGRTGADAIAPHRNPEAADVEPVQGWGQLQNENAANRATRAWEAAKRAREARLAADGGVVDPNAAAPESTDTP